MNRSSWIGVPAVLGAALAVSGCAGMMAEWEQRVRYATTLSPAAEQVVIRPSPGRSCAALGPIETKFSLTRETDAEVQAYISNYVRNVTADLGGDTAVIDDIEAYRITGNPAASGDFVEVRATAYECGTV